MHYVTCPYWSSCESGGLLLIQAWFQESSLGLKVSEHRPARRTIAIAYLDGQAHKLVSPRRNMRQVYPFKQYDSLVQESPVHRYLLIGMGDREIIHSHQLNSLFHQRLGGLNRKCGEVRFVFPLVQQLGITGFEQHSGGATQLYTLDMLFSDVPLGVDFKNQRRSDEAVPG